MGESADKAKKFTCPALRVAIEDRKISRVMSIELMATIRNNSSIPEDKRFPLVRQLIELAEKDSEILDELSQIERNLGCYIPEEKISGMLIEEFVDMQIRVYEATYGTTPGNEFLKLAIDHAKHMNIIDKHRDDPRVQGNR